MKLLLNEITKNPQRIKLEELLKTNRQLAGIIARNAPKEAYSTEYVIIDWENGVYSLRIQYSYFTMTRTDKVYYRKYIAEETTIRGNKIWHKSQGRVRHSYWNVIPNQFRSFMLNKYSWMRFISEDTTLQNIAFNTIITHKLYSYSDCIKYLYKTNYPTAKLIVSSSYAYNSQDWKRFHNTKTLNNLENLNPDFVKEYEQWQLFVDSIHLADVLRKKINCAWSVKRLKAEHDTWAKELTEIVLTGANRPLNIHPDYKKFLDVYPKATLIEDTKSLAIEGKTQGHCVASYTNNVDSGYCAIFHVKGYTLELRKDGDKLKINQFKGFRNSGVPYELNEEVKLALSKLNNEPAPFAGVSEQLVHFEL